jgi:inhibitor of cysteine peptidase
MRRLTRATPALALALALAATAPAPPALAQTDPPTGPAMQPPAGGCGAPASAVGGQDGIPAPQQVQATVGQPFDISLDSNPTTGYRWGLAQPLDETILHLVHSSYQRGGAGLMGAGGEETWIFLPLCQGATMIEMEYRRPWERPEQDDRHASYLVVVQ